MKRIGRAVEELQDGKKRPCCWPGCIHRTDKKPSKRQQAVFLDKTKPQKHFLLGHTLQFRRECPFNYLAAVTTYQKCADEGDMCNVNALSQVPFQVENKVHYRLTDEPIRCNTGEFGDPLRGVVKSCSIRELTYNALSSSLSTASSAASNNTPGGSLGFNWQTLLALMPCLGLGSS